MPKSRIRKVKKRITGGPYDSVLICGQLSEKRYADIIAVAQLVIHGEDGQSVLFIWCQLDG